MKMKLKKRISSPFAGSQSQMEVPARLNFDALNQAGKFNCILVRAKPRSLPKMSSPGLQEL